MYFLAALIKWPIKTFEVEEVCIATNTMPFEDYLECRGFSLVSAIYTSENFDIIAFLIDISETFLNCISEFNIF